MDFNVFFVLLYRYYKTSALILKSIILDKTENNHLEIQSQIDEHHLLTLVNTFNSELELDNFLTTNDDIDIIFIYAEKSTIDALEFNPSLFKKPQVIFYSESTNFAYLAFKYNATDYLKLPLNINEFDLSIQKVLHRKDYSSYIKEQDEDYIFVKSNLKKCKLHIRDIKWVEALGDYIKVVTENDSLVILSTMKAFEDKLGKRRFLRIHKSYIANLNKINRYNGKEVEIGMYKIPLSRNKKQLLAESLNEI